MNQPKIIRSVDIYPTPRELAELFCEMDSEQQATFFNVCVELMKEWPNDRALQFQYINDDKTLTPEARQMIEELSRNIKTL